MSKLGKVGEYVKSYFEYLAEGLSHFNFIGNVKEDAESIVAGKKENKQ